MQLTNLGIRGKIVACCTSMIMSAGCSESSPKTPATIVDTQTLHSVAPAAAQTEAEKVSPDPVKKALLRRRLTPKEREEQGLPSRKADDQFLESQRGVLGDADSSRLFKPAETEIEYLERVKADAKEARSIVRDSHEPLPLEFLDKQ